MIYYSYVNHYDDENVIFYLKFEKNQSEGLNPQAVAKRRTVLLFVFFRSAFEALDRSRLCVQILDRSGGGS